MIKLTRDRYIVLNSPDGDRLIKIVSSLEEAVELCIKYSRLDEINPCNPNSVGKIFKPQLVIDKEKSEYYWIDQGERLPEKGKYFFIVDGLGYYPGNNYPIIKPDGWFHYTEVILFKDLTALMGCRMNEEGCYTYPGYESRSYRKGRHTTMYAREVFKVKLGAKK
jgi:hypothetical protein